ncbi:hypothetical protein M0802_008396 [Mischocyttarus mexicanus]|nr:hypothetical protein M0802_008396 [Mischocyttarus mexicanus]
MRVTPTDDVYVNGKVEHARFPLVGTGVFQQPLPSPPFERQTDSVRLTATAIATATATATAACSPKRSIASDRRWGKKEKTKVISHLYLREQYLFNVFEVIVSTLESKLQRIENLDKAVEHLMRRVEALDSRVNDNIEKTDAVIAKLRTLDLKLFNAHPPITQQEQIRARSAENRRDENEAESDNEKYKPLFKNFDFYHAIVPIIRLIHHDDERSPESLGDKLISLDQKVSDIDHKLVNLKNQLDNNFLQNDDINAEASEKKPVSMSVVEITKAMSNEVMNHVSIEIENLRQATGALDRKLQFHINLVSDNLGAIYNLMTDVHDAIVDKTVVNDPRNLTTTTQPPPKQSKFDRMVGTKNSVDDLLPKSDELLTQTQRQERAINEIHADLRTKTNKIIENLEGVESRLKKQEDDVATLTQRQIPAELLLDPTIDRLVEYDPGRYINLQNENFVTETSSSSSMSATTILPPSIQTSTSTSSTYLTYTTSYPSNNNASSATTPMTPTSAGPQRSTTRNRGVIFPSVKNKPSPANTTFTSDILINYKDIKGFSCVDLLNAGMRDSGVYYLQIRGTTYWFLKVYCEQEIADGGWTVIQRRDDFGEPRENFNRDWADYKNGFGNPGREFWLGNENIYMLTNNEDYMLRVELEDFEGNKRDNDRSSLNCASMLKGGWWWKSCGRGLNGLYLNDPQDLSARQGIVWFRWRGWDYTLKRATMMIKPKGPTAFT